MTTLRSIRARSARLVTLLVIAAGVVSCSPGSLPGSPTLVTQVGGGGRYDGTMTYRRTGGSFRIDETPQGLTMSIALGSVADQFTGQFQAGASRGSLQGVIVGNLLNGTFTATVLVSLPADTGTTASSASGLGTRAAVTCEGTGEATGRFAGSQITWDIGAITYSNCNLSTSSAAAATATSPIPAPPVGRPRANVVITVFPGTTIPRGTCADGTQGFPWAVQVAETGGVGITLKDTFRVVERDASGEKPPETVENPVKRLEAGERRRWAGCETETGTFQAFFEGTDDNGHEIRFSSPIITLGDFVVTSVLTGTITSSASAQPISGATVTVGSVSAATNSSGVYSIGNAPSGSQSVQTSASGFTTRTDTVNIAAGGTTTHSVALTPATGTLTGTISNAFTAQPISGATVAVGGVSATTSSSGVYTISNAPSGSQSVRTSASGFATRTDTVSITAGSSTTFSTALVPASGSGNVTIVLTWGASPADLDAHLVGPTSSGGRFHVAFFDPNPVPHAALDVDDTTGFGPETVTVSAPGGNFVAGSYSFFVDNFSESPGFDVSNARVSVFQGGTQIATFAASSASGSPSNRIWRVFNFTLTATSGGQISITPVQQFTTTEPTLGPVQRRRK